MEDRPELTLTDRLLRYQAERESLLETLVRQAQADPRIAAAWLFGSLGRGDADALSDLDLWLVVEDAYTPEKVAQRRDIAAQAGDPVLLVEAPQNAPRGGGYLMAGYDALVAPHLVDFYWQPLSSAVVPTQTRLLFDQAGLPRVDTPTILVAGDTQSEAIAEPLNTINFFWAMLMICAKGLYRRPAGELALLPHVQAALSQVQASVGLAAANLPAPGPAASPATKLAFLRHLGSDMQTATRRAASQGRIVPEKTGPAGMRYLDFVKALLHL